jgi:hypothetical protein
MFARNGGITIESRAQDPGAEVIAMAMNRPGMNQQSLEPELERALHGVAAPPELWERVLAAQARQPSRSNRRLVWALAATVVLAAVALSMLPARRETIAGNSQLIAFHCQNPAQLRAWVKANMGFDVPVRASLPASIQLIGARSVEGRAEIAYRAGNRDAVLLVSRADVGSANVPHSRARGKVSSWVMDGQRFTLACNDPADFQLACKLCHLD